MRFAEGHMSAMLEENAFRTGAVKFYFAITHKKATQSLLERRQNDAKSEWLSCMVIKATPDIPGYRTEK